MDINDQVEAAIHGYAETLPNSEFGLNLHAAAEHMAPALIAAIGLEQEWAVLTFETFQDEGTTVEVLSCIDDISGNREQVVDRLAYRREATIGTRIVTTWAEEAELVLTPDEQLQLDIDQAPVK